MSHRESAYQYFERHREAVYQRRRERMHDPDYAARVREYFRDYRLKVANGYVPNTRPLMIDGQRFYRQTEVARAVDKTDSAVHYWIRDGWIPEPKRWKGRRVFTERQAELISIFAAINPYDRDARAACSKLILECWEK